MKYDVAIIGGGPAGYTAAERAAQGGLSTVLFEKNALGGVCLNEGCVPTKTLLYSAKIYDSIKHASKYAVKAENPSFDLSKIISRKTKVVKKLTAGIRMKLTEAGVVMVAAEAFIRGRAEDGTITIEANGESYEASHLLVATGSESMIPPIPGLDQVDYWTSREALLSKELPSSLVIIGGGVIGMEFASFFNSLGVEVQVVEMMDKILGPMDRELSAMLQAEYSKRGVKFHLGYKVTSVEKKESSRIASVTATDVDNYRTVRISGHYFADCTGDATLGVLAGADWVMGREARSTYGEPSAPETADGITLGASVQWYSEEEDEPVDFPDIDWGLPIDEDTVQKVRRGQWYWEVGMNDDQINDAEKIRDYGMYVAYSNWSYIKNRSSFRDEYACTSLRWLSYYAGKRESRRLLGDYVLKEQDLRDFRIYDDGCVYTSWYIDNHEPDPDNARHFRDPWLSRGCLTPLDFYPIPVRCFYSRNIHNLFMAGRDISVSHIALGTTRVMRTCAMIGEVVGMACSVCLENGIDPAQIWPDSFDRLKLLMDKGAGNPNRPYTQIYTLIDTTAVRSEDC